MEGRTQRLMISVTPAEKNILEKLADYEGRLSLTATIRHIILDAARERNLMPSDKRAQPELDSMDLEQQGR